MVAFITAVIILAAAIGAVVWYAGRRPQGAPLTWGQAVLGAAFSWFFLLWSYGMVPHLWIAWADNDWHWRSDKILLGPAGLLKANRVLPFTLTYQTLRDIIVLVIYGVMVGLQIVLWSFWQSRGKRQAAPALETSTYGRPLVKQE